jgi:hypothetical protein
MEQYRNEGLRKQKPLDIPTYQDILKGCDDLTRHLKFEARSNFIDGAKWAIAEIEKRNK